MVEHNKDDILLMEIRMRKEKKKGKNGIWGIWEIVNIEELKTTRASYACWMAIYDFMKSQKMTYEYMKRIFEPEKTNE